TNLNLIPSGNQISLAWTPISISDFWKYQIFRTTFSLSTTTVLNDNAPVVEFTTSTANIYVDGGLQNGVTYFYQIFSVDKGTPTYLGTALSSATAIISTVTAQLLPNQPVILSSDTIALSTTAINRAWSEAAPPTVLGFRVFIGTNNISGDLPPTTT